MKTTAKILVLISIFIMFLILAACLGETPNGSESGPSGVSAPNDSGNDPPDGSVSNDSGNNDSHGISASALLTYDEAMAIARAWLDDHTDLPSSYTIHDWSNPPDEIPPPTYSLFGIEYYEFPMVSNWDETYSNGYVHYVLVHAETGELLSSYCDFYLGTDGKDLRDVSIEELDDWYNDSHAAYTPAVLSADESIAIYDVWKNERYGDNPDYSGLDLHRKSYGKYEIFGEQYYYFRAEDSTKYWYNILVHMGTGELLHVTIYDGMFGGEDVMLLDDWFDKVYTQ